MECRTERILRAVSNIAHSPCSFLAEGSGESPETLDRNECGAVVCKSQLSLEHQREMASFEALVGALHPPESEIRMLAALQAYMDESSDKERRIFTIGGFIGRADEWRELLFDWIDRIEPRKLPNPIRAFHMTDCENGGGEFRDELGWDRDSRRQLIIDLLDIICRYNVGLFGLGLPIKEYELLDPVNPEKGLKLGYSQYHLLFQLVLREMASEMEEGGFPGHEEIAFFFDRNSPHEFWANHLHKRMQQEDEPRCRRIGPLTFHNKERMRMLQVADVGAFESMKSITNIAYKEGRTRKSFDKLLATDHIWRISKLNSDGLKQMVTEKKKHLSELATKR